MSRLQVTAMPLYFLGLFLMTSCSSLKHDSSVLKNEKFQNVYYLSNPNPKKLVKAEKVSVLKKGHQANILYTLPSLYEEAMKVQKGRVPSSSKSNYVFLSDLKFKPYTRREPFQVSYQECKTEYTSRQDCSYRDYNGNTQCRTVTDSEQVCETKYRTEIKDVLYQRATAQMWSEK